MRLLSLHTDARARRPRLLLIGVNALSQAVAMGACALGFEVFLSAAPPVLSIATQAPCMADLRYLEGRSDDVVHGLRVDADTAVLLLVSGDPQSDDLALFEALERQAFYVGVIEVFLGQERCKQRLAEYFDLSERTLAKLHSPLALMDPAAPCAQQAQWILQALVFCKNVADAALLQAHAAQGGVPVCGLETVPV